jgi:hypothetical protein
MATQTAELQRGVGTTDVPYELVTTTRMPLKLSIGWVALLGALPLGMLAPAVLMLASRTTGSYAEAGRFAALLVVSVAAGAVAQSRLMARLGPARVVLPATLVHVTGLILVVGGASFGLTAAMGLGLIYAGACLPQLLPAARGAWARLAADTPARQAGRSPVIAPTWFGALSGVVVGLAVAGSSAGPASAVLIASGLTVLGAIWMVAIAHRLAWGPVAETAARPKQGRRARLARAGLIVLGLQAVVLGGAVGVIGLGTLATNGPEAVSALVGGVLLGGLLRRRRPKEQYTQQNRVREQRAERRPERNPGRPARRLMFLLAAFGYTVALLTVTPQPYPAYGVLALAGLLLAGCLRASAVLIGRLAPGQRPDDGYPLAVTAGVAGTAAGMALGGAVIEQTTFVLVVLVAAGAAEVAAIVVGVGRRHLDSHLRG